MEYDNNGFSDYTPESFINTKVSVVKDAKIHQCFVVEVHNNKLIGVENNSGDRIEFSTKNIFCIGYLTSAS